MSWLRNLEHLLLNFYGHHEVSALFGFLFVEEAGVPLPLPGDTLIAFSGTRHHGSLAFGLLIVGIATLAVFCGSSLLYMLMRRGGRPALERYGRWLHISPSRLAQIETWFQERGMWAVIIGRLIPGMRIPTTVMAGITAIPYRVFLPATFAAAVIWSTAYYFLGIVLARAWRRAVTFITGDLDNATRTLILVLVIGAGVTALVLWQRQRFAQRHPASALSQGHPKPSLAPRLRPRRRGPRVASPDTSATQGEKDASQP